MDGKGTGAGLPLFKHLEDEKRHSQDCYQPKQDCELCQGWLQQGKEAFIPKELLKYGVFKEVKDGD